MTRSLIPGVLAMATIVVVSNILVQFLIGDWLTWGAFTYPFAFLVNDLTNRFQGPAAARKVVLAGFVVGLVCSFIGNQIEGPFGPLVNFRVAVGSALAFLVGQMADIFVFNRLRATTWWRAPFISTLVGSSLDTAIFFSVAFSAAFSFVHPGLDVLWANEPRAVFGIGPVLPFWAGLAVADWIVKVAIDFVALIPFRLFIQRLAAKVA